MRCSLVFVSLVLGCAFDSTGQGSGSGLGGSSSSAGGSTSSAGSSSTTAGLDDSGSGPATTTTTTGTSDTSSSSGEPDTGSTGEPPPPTAHSCAEILADDPMAPTGKHTILSSTGAVVPVYCEMQLVGGGWTLVGRSEPGGSEVDFGWGEAQGSLGDEQAPYSLDARAVGLPFTEILITRRTGFATPSDNAYVVEVPPGFIEDYQNDNYEHPGPTTVLGDCDPDPPPSMLRRVGYTSNDHSFYIRDVSLNDDFGLFSNRFRMAYDDCSQGADLDGEQGALFVR